MEVAKDVASEARFTSLDGIGAFADLNDFFRDDFENR